MNKRARIQVAAEGPVADFVVAAVAPLQERRPIALKHGDMFAVFDHNGDATSWPGSPEGLYYRDTRHLSQLELRLNGTRPLLLSSTLRDDNATLTCDLTNPDLHDEVEGELPHDLIQIRRSRFLWCATCYERISVRSFDHRKRELLLEICFASDFADLFEVRGTRRARRGVLHRPAVGRDSVVLSYTGLDGRDRRSVLRFDRRPDKLSGAVASYALALEPRETLSIFITVGCDIEPCAPRTGFPAAMRAARRALRISTARAAGIETSNDTFNEAVRRSVSDLYMLITDMPEGPYPYAGIPWFSTVFGRDALITALETLWIDPDIARGVLLFLAANQATDIDPAADAEPGKIVHEMRNGEMAELGEVPFRRYYGSVDSTPLFVMLAGRYFERTRDVGTIARLWPHVVSALLWIETYGDRDGDGFIDYYRQSEKGLANQGWKDSHDSVFHSDGTLAVGPIALCEVQSYVYGAFTAAAAMAQALGQDEAARHWSEKAERLRAQFDAAFFDEQLGTFVLALDGKKKPCRVPSSNAGHALFSGIAWPERAEPVVRTLMASPSFSGWGIRTIPTTEARYNPMSYHNGSVWPHDNALIAAGLARYGFHRETARVFEGLFAASTYMDLRRLPELFCGMPRRRGQGPTLYPVACVPQAWAAAAPLSMLHSCLSLSFDAGQAQITFDDPCLPAFLDEVVLRGLRLGSASVDVALTRARNKVVADVLHRTGPIKVVTVG